MKNILSDKGPENVKVETAKANISLKGMLADSYTETKTEHNPLDETMLAEDGPGYKRFPNPPKV